SGLVPGLSSTVGEREVGPPVGETIPVLHGGGQPLELLLERAPQARLFLLLGGGRFQGEDGPLRGRPRLPVRPVGRGVDSDILVLQVLGSLHLALLIAEAKRTPDEDPLAVAFRTK